MTESCNIQEPDVAPPDMPRSARLWAQHVIRKIASLLRHKEGGIAVEFAILSPFAAAALLFLSMVGVNVYQRIDIEQILRVGAEAARNDPGWEAVEERMRQIALAKGYTLGNPGETLGFDRLSLIAARACACPGSQLVTIDCSSICPGDRPPLLQYELVANFHRAAEAGLLRALGRLGFRATRIYAISNLRTRVILR